MSDATSPMKSFYGTKRVFAVPMTRGAYNQYRGWETPKDENPHDTGYLLEYADGGAPNDPRHKGYISWSPSDVFEASYQPTSGLSFGHALVALKEGKKVSRAGWNGKGMYLILVSGTPKAQLREGTAYRDASGLEECEILPHIDMWTVNAEGRCAFLPGWLASQTDMLSNDWQIVEA